MPRRLPKPCRYPLCHQLVEHPLRYCTAHAKHERKFKKETAQQLDPEFRARDAFYSTPQWRRLRRWHLVRNPLCIECGTAGTMVDHRLPIRLGGEKLDPNNLQTMCDSCHAVKRQSEREKSSMISGT